MKIAVITGASSGIGREFAVQLDRLGLDELWVIARREDRLAELKTVLRTPVRVIPLDLTDAVSMNCYRELLAEHKPAVQWLVNASGYGKFGFYDEISIEEGRKMIDLNVQALVELTVSTLPFVPSGGHVVQMASVAGFQPLPNFNLYAAGKAFVLSYTRGLREELRPRGISATAVCPGWVATEFIAHTEQGNTRKTLREFKPILPADRVVRQALSDAAHSRPVSVCGLYNKTQHVLAKLLPNRLLIRAWDGMQEQRKE